MSRIYCPYCGISYDIDKSLMPEDNVKVRCRSCANVFILDKEAGAIKNDEHNPEDISQTENGTETDGEDKESKDFTESMTEDTDDSQGTQASKEGAVKKKVNMLQIITMAILILILIVAIISALDYYKIINLPFISEWLSQFR